MNLGFELNSLFNYKKTYQQIKKIKNCSSRVNSHTEVMEYRSQNDSGNQRPEWTS